jgi:hypothetical protein
MKFPSKLKKDLYHSEFWICESTFTETHYSWLLKTLGHMLQTGIKDNTQLLGV